MASEEELGTLFATLAAEAEAEAEAVTGASTTIPTGAAAASPDAAQAKQEAAGPSAASTGAALDAAEPTTDVRILFFGCQWGCWCDRVPVNRDEAYKLLRGKNDLGRAPHLLCRATTRFGRDQYTMVVFGGRAAVAPDCGKVDGDEFRRILSRYKRGTAANKDCYVIRTAADGSLVDFGELSGGFTLEYFAKQAR